MIDGCAGVHCETRVYDCAVHSCANNATCLPAGPLNYTCECRPNHYGDFCQFTTGDFSCSLYRLEHDGECTARSKCTVEAVWGSSKPSVSVDGQLAVRGARTGVRLAESRSSPKVETDFQRVSASCRSTETLDRELQQADETVHQRLAVQSPSYSNVLSNGHKMSDLY